MRENRVMLFCLAVIVLVPATSLSGTIGLFGAYGTAQALGQLDGSAEPSREKTDILSEVEPNNTVDESNELATGGILAGGLGKNDSDCFRVVSTLKVRDWIEFKMERRSATLRPGLTLYGADKSEIASAVGDDDGAGISLRHVMAPGEAIYARLWAREETGGAYRFSVNPEQASDEYEPNDRLADATAMTIGKSMTASIMDPGDNDYFRMRSSEEGGAGLIVYIENMSDSLAPAVALFDSMQIRRSYGYVDRQGSDLENRATITPGEEYYLQVWPRGDSYGEYRVTVEQY